MQIKAYIKTLNAKVESDGGVVQEMKLVFQGDMKDVHDLMKKPLTVTMEPMQIEFGKGDGPPPQKLVRKKKAPHA